ncbi:MAG: hypothetical protein ACOC7U_08275, partial [Spirochaetota bacterium]
MKYLVCIFAAVFLCALPAAHTIPDSGQNTESFYAEVSKDVPIHKNRRVHLDIECHSGTPPVLEFVLRDYARIVKGAGFDFDSDGNIELEVKNKGNEVLFRGVPYRQPGKYRPTVYLYTDQGKIKREYIVSFTEFVWGRDNFRFANDGEFENAIDFVSDTIIEWAEERFGPLTTRQKLIVLEIMYSIYRGSIGRCYGFTGGEIFYQKNPEILTESYECTYQIPEDDKRIITQMDYV